MTLDAVALFVGFAAGGVGGFGAGWIVGRDLAPPPGDQTRRAVEALVVTPAETTVLLPDGRRVKAAEYEEAMAQYVELMNGHARMVT